MLSLIVPKTTEKWCTYARYLGINQVVDLAIPWVVMLRYPVERLPVLMMECDQHPYEVLGQWYGDDIPAVAANPPECRNRTLSKEDMTKAVIMQALPHKRPDAGKTIWLPGMQFHDGQHQPKCGRCGTQLKTNKDGSLADYRCPWCGLTAFVDVEGVPHCMTCGSALRVEKQGPRTHIQEQAYCALCGIRYIKTDSDVWQGCYINIVRKGDKPE